MFSNLPPVTKALLIANGVVFVLQRLLGQAPFAMFELWPLTGGAVPFPGGFYPWQLVTYSFLHGGFMHLFSNMLPLLMFGAQLEYTWGSRRFTRFYAACVVGAGLCQLAVSTWMFHEQHVIGTTVGASGGVLGLLIAFGMVFPNQRIMLLIPPIPIRARTMVLLWVILVLLGVAGLQEPGVAHFAHLGGMVTGWLMLRYWRGQPPFGKGGPRRPRIVR